MSPAIDKCSKTRKETHRGCKVQRWQRNLVHCAQRCPRVQTTYEAQYQFMIWLFDIIVNLPSQERVRKHLRVFIWLKLRSKLTGVYSLRASTMETATQISTKWWGCTLHITFFLASIQLSFIARNWKKVFRLQGWQRHVTYADKRCDGQHTRSLNMRCGHKE
jgi:hypothetical protein